MNKRQIKLSCYLEQLNIEVVKVEMILNQLNRLKNNQEITNEVKRIYKINYWDRLELDDIPSQKIAHELFDTAVNCGVTTSIRLAQQVCNMTITGKFTPELKHNLMQYGKV